MVPSHQHIATNMGSTNLSNFLEMQANANISPIDSDYEDEPELFDTEQFDLFTQASTTNFDSEPAVKVQHSYQALNQSEKTCRKKLLERFRRLTERYSVDYGKQIVVIVANPDSEDARSRLSVVGTQPLKRVVKNAEKRIMNHLWNALNSNGLFSEDIVSQSFNLPALVFDGIQTSVAAMNQSQLRTLIPLIIKYSTGRQKPMYGKAGRKPRWWPNCVPWTNIRYDTRDEIAKREMSWTNALRQVIINCYTYHNRLDLLDGSKDLERVVSTGSVVEQGSSQGSHSQFTFTTSQNNVEVDDKFEDESHDGTDVTSIAGNIIFSMKDVFSNIEESNVCTMKDADDVNIFEGESKEEIIEIDSSDEDKL